MSYRAIEDTHVLSARFVGVLKVDRATPLVSKCIFTYDVTNAHPAEHPDISKILLSDHLSHLGGEKPSARVNELKRRSRQFVAQCLQDAADSGTMASGVTVNGATIMVLGAILAVGHATTRVADESETDRLTTEVWSAIEKMRREPERENEPQRGGHPR